MLMTTKTCPKCGPKPIAEFNWRNKSKNIRANECRDCHKAYNKSHYLQNKSTYVDRAGTRNAKIRKENRRKIYDYLLAHPCSCGEVDPRALDFDHNDPKTKRANVANLTCRSWPFILEEIHKCTVRCANCHRKKTATQQNWYPWLESN